MKKIKQIVAMAAVALSSFAMTSCDKDDDNPVDTCQTNAASVSGSYKITSLTLSGTEALQDCLKDDVVTLKNDGTFTTDQKGTQCAVPYLTSGAWTINTSGVTLGGTAYTIDSWDCKRLVVSGSYNGLPIKTTFVKQ